MSDKRKYNNIERDMSNGYISLANAIVKQAADDYRMVLRNFDKFPQSRELNDLKYEIESFFNGDWITMLINTDGNYIMRILQKEAELI